MMFLRNRSCIINGTYLLAIEIKSKVFYGLKIQLLPPITARLAKEISRCDVWQAAYRRPVFTINKSSHWLFKMANFRVM